MQIEDDGRNDFDFLVGNGIMRHRRLKERLTGCTEWEEFEGTAVGKKLLNGLGHCDEVVMNRESGPTTALRCGFSMSSQKNGASIGRPAQVACWTSR